MATVNDFWVNEIKALEGFVPNDFGDLIEEDVLFNALFTHHAYSWIDAEIAKELGADITPAPLDGEFGEYYWNGKRMVLRPGFID